MTWPRSQGECKAGQQWEPTSSNWSPVVLPVRDQGPRVEESSQTMLVDIICAPCSLFTRGVCVLCPQPPSPLPDTPQFLSENEPQSDFPFSCAPSIGRAASSGNCAIFQEALTTSLQSIWRGGGGQKPMNFQNSQEYVHKEFWKNLTSLSWQTQWKTLPPPEESLQPQPHTFPTIPRHLIWVSLQHLNLDKLKMESVPSNISTYHGPDLM